MRQPLTFAAMRGLTSSLLLTAASALVSMEAVAECPPLPDAPATMDRPQWVALAQGLKRNLSQCLSDSSYFALLGAALLETGKLPDAIEMLERSLMLNPDNGGAMIDYAGALYLSGDTAAAIRINERLISNNDTPPAIRKMLKGRTNAWKSDRVTWVRRVSLLYGYHDNLNGVADLDELLITTNVGEVALLVDQDSQPISGSFLSSRISLQRYNRLPDGPSFFDFSVQSRTSDERESDTTELNAGYHREMVFGDSRHLIDLEVSHLQYGGRQLYWQTTAEYEHHWFDAALCSPLAGFEAEWLRFQELQYMDELSVRLSGGVKCGGRISYIEVAGSYGHNFALKSRPGGDRSGGDVSVKWQRELNPGIINAQFKFGTYDDRLGYSELLSYNEERSSDIYGVSIQYLHPLSRYLSFQAGINYRRQKSNIAIFNTDAFSAVAGFTLSF